MVSPVEKVNTEIVLEISGIDIKYLSHYPINFKQLPSSWIPIYVGEVLIDIRPGFASGEHNQIGEGIPHIRPMNINRKGEIELLQIKFVDPNKSNLRLNPNDILFNNTNSPDLIGKTSAIHNCKDWGYSNHMTRLTPHKNVSYRYIAYQLHFLWMTGYYRNRCVHHVNQASISSQVFAKTIPIVLAPFAEQHRIVEKIEELFSDLDKGIESLKTTQQQLKIYRQAVLKWAFEGKLTAKWREEKKQQGELKSADELLAQIKAEREKRDRTQLQEWNEAVRTWETNGKQGKKPGKPKKTKELQFLIENEVAELPKLPEGWCWLRLGDVSSNIQIGPFGSLLHKSDYVLGQIPIVNPSHIKEGKIVPDSNLTITTEKFSELSNYGLYQGDIVFGRRGEMGRCAVVTEKEHGYLCGTGSLLIRLINTLDSNFFCLALSSHRVRNYLENASIGTTMRNLNEDILNNVPVPVCASTEQIEVIQEIEFRLSICDRLEATITENITRAEALRQSILKQAFEGKLVPQDPNDEPAEKLLERIKQEKLDSKNGKQLELEVFCDKEIE